jgi:hypothetical protein
LNGRIARANGGGLLDAGAFDDGDVVVERKAGEGIKQKLPTRGRVVRILVGSFLDRAMEAPPNSELRLPGWWIKS